MDYKGLVKKVALLARIEISDAEVPEFARNFENILSYIDRLSNVDVAGVEPMSHVHGSTNVFREDVPEQSLSVETLKSIAPSTSGRFIKVPLIIDQNTEH